MKACWPAPERNKEPILEQLRRFLPASGTLLEIASGSGQHAAYFSEQLPSWTWMPSDIDPDNLASIRSYCEDSRGENLRPPISLDVRSHDWPVPELDAVFNANMIHIAPWPCCLSMLDGVARHLRPGGVFMLYGPFRIGREHTSPSNAAFDAKLREQNERWGVRDMEDVTAHAASVGLAFIERVPMPAHNQTLVFQAGQAERTLAPRRQP